jgi:hypothetical protein
MASETRGKKIRRGEGERERKEEQKQNTVNCIFQPSHLAKIYLHSKAMFLSFRKHFKFCYIS